MKTQFRYGFTGRLSRLLLLPMLLASALGSAPLSSAHAIGSTITVDTLNGGLVDGGGSGDCSLAEAIDNANNDGGGTPRLDCALGTGEDTIVFSVSGTIMLSATLPTINDPQNERTTIDGDGNIAIDGSGGESSGIVYVNNKATFEQLIFENANDTCCSAGAVVVDTLGDLTVTQSTFLNNYATGNGGAILNDNTLIVDRSTFAGNGAGNGGGAIYNAGAAWISNSTFYDNYASSAGGGGVASTGSTSLHNTTFSQNSSPAGTGAAVSSQSGTVFIYNSILANSTSGYDCSLDGGGAISSYSLIEADNCGFTDGVDGMILGKDPRLGPLANVPAYFLLRANSPAIDAGDLAHQLGSLDEPGFPRVVDTPWAPDALTGNYIDMGAYEYTVTCPVVPRFYVDAGASGASTGDSWTDAFPDLQMALISIGSCGTPDEVWVAGGVYTPDGGSPGDQNLELHGPGRDARVRRFRRDGILAQPERPGHKCNHPVRRPRGRRRQCGHDQYR